MFATTNINQRLILLKMSITHTIWVVLEKLHGQSSARFAVDCDSRRAWNRTNALRSGAQVEWDSCGAAAVESAAAAAARRAMRDARTAIAWRECLSRASHNSLRKLLLSFAAGFVLSRWCAGARPCASSCGCTSVAMYPNAVWWMTRTLAQE